ncbi:60S ribosomal protein L31 [Candidatus Woesearchaeota archaeon]|nr:60S ribosomal protein L31 [Candidatus Woesearchaeota archaeon]
MANLERTYNVPLRKEFLKAPLYKRANKALIALRQFIAKHMKAEKVIIGNYLNRKIWERGIKRPPHHVKITAIKDEKGVVTAELVGAPKPKAKEKKQPTTEKKEVVQKEAEELKQALAGELEKNAQITAEKPEETKAEEKPKPHKKAPAKKAVSEKPKKASAKKTEVKA